MHIVHTCRPTYTVYYKLYTFIYRFLVGYVLVFAIFMAFILITSLQERGLGGPQPGTTLLQYIHWLCTQVMAMMNDDVMIECFFFFF